MVMKAALSGFVAGALCLGCNAFVAPGAYRSGVARTTSAAASTAVSPASSMFAPALRTAQQLGLARLGTEPLEAEAARAGLTMMSAAGKKVAVITGASSGIGLEAAKQLAATGDWYVVMAVRTFAKAEKAARDLGMNPESYAVMDLDLASLTSVRKFVSELKEENLPVDALVCNAAVWYPKDKKPRTTPDGFEEAVGVNHLGHFALINLLMPQLEKSKVIFIGTETHNPGSIAGKIPPQAHLGDLEGLAKGEGMIDGGKFEPTKAYKDSKVCNVLMMREMNKRFKCGPDGGMTVSALFPGCIAESPLFREKRGWFRKIFPLFQKYITKQYVSVEEAGRRVKAVVSEPEYASSGTYWRWNGQDAEATARENVVSDEAMDDARCAKLWDISAKLVGVCA